MSAPAYKKIFRSLATPSETPIVSLNDSLLNHDAFQHIISFCSIESILSLSCTSKELRLSCLCENSFWKSHFKKFYVCGEEAGAELPKNCFSEYMRIMKKFKGSHTEYGAILDVHDDDYISVDINFDGTAGYEMSGTAPGRGGIGTTTNSVDGYGNEVTIMIIENDPSLYVYDHDSCLKLKITESLNLSVKSGFPDSMWDNTEI
mmetsp:Transcript_29138/g.32354  ORF Transcript_29138/g.32354 Transcript_29138/m.32354 type:complete len:204 (-) Transcript_29138:29-640(-)